MIVVLGHLPQNTGEKEIRELLFRFAPVTNVFFFDTTKCSDYECMVTMSVSSPIVASILASKLNSYCWKGHTISSHQLLF